MVKSLIYGLLLTFSVAFLSNSTGGGEPTGTITIAGSTSMEPLSRELGTAFERLHPNVKVIVYGGGSGAGIKAAMMGEVDIGASSRELKEEEKILHAIPIARDGIVVIVNRRNRVNGLTIEQLRAVYAGRIADWRELGGPRRRIVLVNREPGSGTRGAFEEIVMHGESMSDEGLEQTSTASVKLTVAANPGAVGYISFGALDKTVKALAIDGVSPSELTIMNGSYKLQRPFLYLTKNPPTGLVKAYLDFVLSPAGQAIVAREYIPVKPR
ncbi:MAG: phosphate ABC transporter substrate-binding protein [Firmicutes bacterium]|nr:phosphate ABC transporter substrate-binding protein [Bacillota bacterium]